MGVGKVGVSMGGALVRGGSGLGKRSGNPLPVLRIWKQWVNEWAEHLVLASAGQASPRKPNI